ncbi:sulfurtransferase TusA family protein [Thalassotalea sp. 1_MG-2023]|uniref:sulfurtransferase TusA family protein n=1 Tax=Thalassotalea sp. 1_MG-2023 TaxID=3062680 RepID=UPI0026E44B50|nr:sulfurtransferase TusA family protein [Thalassotalea sp. 1_MG-2023]MDO6428402.1 sulfurtransferase TusA family protein [Thalassotalea sp. 1_MG-2023]
MTIYQYDGTNDKCPLPLVKMRVLLKKLTKHDVCIIQISDPGSLSDIPKFLQQKGYHFQQSQLNVKVTELRITTGK